ncbi:MAG: CARDB domain-containing protein [Saprospiraceae bacterium]|nr:CARDB domain-containing protein [Saprospiraceae bacterium]
MTNSFPSIIRGKVIPIILFHLVFLQFNGHASIDLHLSISTSNQNPAKYSNINVETIVTNNSSEMATEVVVEVPISDLAEIVYSGGNEFSASQGSFYPYGTEIWEVGDLNPGESATLTTNYFVLEESSYTIYAQVLYANESDIDSTPNNGTPPTPNEDDEIALIFNDTGGGICDISYVGIEAVCDDNGTPNDPNDDQWFAHINPEGSGLSATFSISGNITANKLSYGQNYIFGPYPNDPDLYSVFAITDDEFGCSNSFILVNGSSCSVPNTCQITGEVISIDCSDKGTPNDPNDDTWGYIINVTGTNTSNNWFWELPGGNATYTGIYDQPALFTNNPLTGSETVTIDIRDQVDVNCTTSISVDAPFPCVTNDLPDIALNMNSTSTGGAFVYVSFDIQVANTGDADATGLFVQVPLPDDAIPQGGNEFSATAGIVGGLNTWNWQLATLSPGQTETLTVNYFTLSDTPITGYAQVVAMIGDDEDSTPNNGTLPIPNEDDETAFTIGGVPSLPDLTASNLVLNLPDALEIGVDYSLSFDLNNIGNTIAAGDFRIGIYLSLDEVFDANQDILVGQVVTGNIANTTPINALINIEDTTPSQDYFLLVVADDLQAITELEEGNNVLSSDNTFGVFNINDGCTGLFEATSQAELDQFPQACTTWAGSIKLSGNITDLSPLANLDIILGNLIFEACEVTDFSPISGLKEAGTLFFYFNPNLTNLNGLPENISTRAIQIIGNPNLTSLDGLPNIFGELDNLTVANNINLKNIEGLSGITGDHPELVLVVNLNPALTSLSGLENITAVNILSIAQNEKLTECCPIFELLNANAFNNANISDNQIGCNSVSDILDFCDATQCQITVSILDIQCQNQGTLDDESDDTFSARILVEDNSGCQGNFLIDGQFGGIFGGNGIFGEQAVVGNYPISDGDVTIEITDVNGENGVLVTLEAPDACSNGTNPDECGFENTYPPIPEFLNIISQKAVETADGYDLEMFGNAVGAPLLVYYDLSVDLAGTELSNSQTILPVNGFRRVESSNFYAMENVSNTEMRLRKVDNSGVTVWEKTFTFDSGAPQGIPEARDVIEVSDGTVFLVSTNGPTDNSWLLKTDNDGTVVYNNPFQEENGFLNYRFEGEAQNGDFLIYRQSFSRVGFLIRASATGDLVYQKSIVGDLVTSRMGEFAETADGNFIYVTYRDQLTPKLEKLDAFTGERIWAINLSNTFSPNLGPINSLDGGSVIATSDGGAVVSYAFSFQFTNNDIGFEYGRLSASGLLDWWQHLPAGYDLDAELETSDGGFLFAGGINGTFGIVKTTSEGLLTPTCVDDSNQVDLYLTLDSDPIFIGSGNIIHTLTITNDSPIDATGVRVQFYQGNSFIEQAQSVTSGNYNINTDIWDIGIVEAGNTETLVLEELFVDFEFATQASTTFFEVIASDQEDSDSTPNNDNGEKTDDEDDEVSIEIFPLGTTLPYDLSAVLGTASSALNLGETFTFNFNIHSDGNYAVAGVIAQLDIPTGLQIISSQASQGSFDETTGEWIVGYFLSGDLATLTIEATLIDDTQEVIIFGQIESSDNTVFDFDSEPGNGVCCIVNEDDEAVLIIAKNGNILKPDLTVENVILNINPSETNFDISFDERNIGDLSSNNHTIRIIISEDAIFSADDELLTIRYNINQFINPGESIPFSTQNLPFPSLDPGDYFLLVFADFENQNEEINETNNVSATPFTISVPSVIDLELEMTTSNPNPSAYSFFDVSLTLSNVGGEHGTGVIVDVPLPDGLTYEGGNEYATSQGTFTPYGNQQWNVGNLNAGESVTLVIHYFVLDNDNPAEIYAQIIAQTPNDLDSSPNNGTPPIANEDDEAVLILFNNSTPVMGVQGESFSFQALKAGDFMTEIFWAHNRGESVEKYVVERSFDQVNFEPLFEQHSNGEDTFEWYRNYDETAQIGDNFYRLKIIKQDGTIEYSEVRSIHFTDLIDFTLFPNPANKFVKVNLEKVVGVENVGIEIYNNLGILVFEKAVSQVTVPYNQLDLRALHEGVYTVYLKVPNRKPIAKRLMIGRR